MPRIPLEDNFTDIIGKTQRGLKLSDDALAAAAKVPLADLKAVQGGEIREHTLLAIAKPLGLERNALLALARREWYPEQPVFKRGFAAFNTAFEDMTVNSYLVWDAKTKLAAPNTPRHRKIERQPDVDARTPPTNGENPGPIRVIKLISASRLAASCGSAVSRMMARPSTSPAHPPKA